MCVDPASMFLIASVASAGVNAYASIQSGNAQYQAGMYNAQIQERNAQAVEDEKKNVQDAAAIERRRLGERVAAERGELVARYANMGLDPEMGTPADLIGDVQRAYDIDRTILGRNELTELGRLDKQQADFIDAGRLARSEAKSARKAGMVGAFGSFLDGTASVSGRWIQPPANANAPLARGLKKPAPATRSSSVLKVGAG